MARRVSTRAKAAALQRGLAALGLKPLHERAGVAPRSTRRWADGSRSPSEAQRKRIDRLYRQYEDRIAELARVPAREVVEPRTGEIIRKLGRYRLPDLTLADIAESAGRARQPDNTQLAALGREALLDVLEPGGIDGMPAVHAIGENGEPVPLYFGGLPIVIDGVVGLFVVQEYRRGRQEMFVDRVALVPGAPTLTQALADAGATDGIIRTPAEAHAFAQSLATNWREAYTRIELPDHLIGPSSIVANVSLDRLTMGGL